MAEQTEKIGVIMAEMKHKGSQRAAWVRLQQGHLPLPPSWPAVPAVGAALTGVAGGRALLRPVASGSEGQRPRVRIRGIGSGVHIPFQNKPTGL